MKYLFILLFIINIRQIDAQQSTIQGQVIDIKGLPIPGATVTGNGIKNRAITDQKGGFKLNPSVKQVSLTISFIGFATQQIVLDQSSDYLEIILLESTENLDEFVVTALGVERQRQSLSSSVYKIGTRELTDVPQTNLINSLSGQVAGVQVTNGSSGIGSSARIIIRGESSLSSNNQALIVIDGIPISNQMISSDLFNDGANIQEVDFGNGASEISPEDIESISILKGPGSAALYGTRGANGVVLITTKKGKRMPGIGVSLNSTLTLDGLLTLPDYQNVYGGGSRGEYAFQNGIGAGVNDGGISSYGPKLNTGLLVKQFTGPSVDVNGNPVRAGDVISRTRPDGSFTPITATPWIARPDNVRDFYRTGVTSQNNLSVSGSNEKGGVRISYSNLRNEGILPNTDLNRDGLSISLNQKVTDRLKVDFFGNYINSRSNNRPNLGYGYENVQYGFNWTGRQTDIGALRDYWQAGQTGIQHYDFNYLWLTNPYLTLFENTNSFNKNRILGNLAISYELTDKLIIRVRTGLDNYSDNRAFRRAFSTNRRLFGGYREDNVRFNELNSDVLLSYSDEINSSWKYTVNIGVNRLDQKINYGYTEAGQLALPGIYTLENSRVPLRGSSQIFTKRINSGYVFGDLSYRSILFFDLTLRNDWSSTLPEANNSFAYYSGGFSYVFSNQLNLPKTISTGRFRFNLASVGNDTDPYQLNNTFQFNQNYGSFTRVTNRTVLNNPNLKPERINAIEFGLNLGLWEDQVMLDISTYQNTSINQIIGRPISAASGFSNKVENGGQVRTRGFEASLNAFVLDKGTLNWTMGANFTTYRSVVIELPDGVDQYVTGEASVFAGSGGSNSVFYIAKKDGRIGDMYGSGFQEFEGQIIYGTNGLPIQDEKLRLLGNYNPNFILGLTNQFRYKGFQLGFVVDWRQGGTLVSRTRALGSTSGVLTETLVGRETGVIGAGVKNVGTPENPQYITNTTLVPASTFYNNFFDRGNEASATYDASYVKLRQLSLYYDLPSGMVNRIGFQAVKVGVVGSNLLLFTENPHVDPELNALQGRNITYGVEDMSYPSTRSIGFSIKTQF
jgi:TonB-linked SusC/RagA family outer membrane protein